MDAGPGRRSDTIRQNRQIKLTRGSQQTNKQGDIQWPGELREINDGVSVKINQSGSQAANLMEEKRDKVAQLKFEIEFSRLSHEMGISTHQVYCPLWQSEINQLIGFNYFTVGHNPQISFGLATLFLIPGRCEWTFVNLNKANRMKNLILE